MNTKIFLAATSHVKTAIVPYFKPHYILESFMDIKSKTKLTEEYVKWCLTSDMFLLDSGAYTFMNKSKKSKEFTNDMFHDYLEEYIDFINKWDIKYFFELDLDCVIGYEKVKEVREYLEYKTNKKCIPVWHKDRGIEDFHEMCRNYDYIAIGGIASKEIKKSEHSLLYELCNIAHSYGCKVHGLGYIPLDILNNRECPFDTVDGTSWQGHMRGQEFYIDENKRLKKIKVEKYWKEVAWNCFNQWDEFSKIIESEL